MNHEVGKRNDGLDIMITDVEGKEGQLLEAFQECQEGHCSCPTNEYKKLESLRVEVGDGKIDLRLTAKSGQALDEAEIERCLDYTEKQTRA
jgi:hypothetical protein